ncbi:zonular occludens toxin domain-containing protein (plasmid) [Brevibacillus fluminis]|uniref:zonular occludens toxin domain-containing protein n=1 Tax=Brevibacillus fluminis TaxID=511487 RepID=UPI003F8A7C62
MIEAFTGLPGQGKTYLMTRLAMKKMRKGRKVYANYPLKGAERWTQVTELFNVRDAVILIDEAGLVAPAGFWKDIPFEVMAHWRQHRHKGVDLWYTAQSLKDVAVPLRRVTQFENKVQKMGPLIWWKCINPQTSDRFAGGFTIFDQAVADAYDSWADDVEKQVFLKG